MTFNELPTAVQQQLNNERLALKNKNRNDAYTILLYNEQGSRYFYARREQRGWYDTKTGNSMPFGGGSYWRIAYGRVQFEVRKDPLGGKYYELCNGERFTKAANGTEVLRAVPTKKDVLDIAKAIGIFNLN